MRTFVAAIRTEQAATQLNTTQHDVTILPAQKMKKSQNLDILQCVHCTRDEVISDAGHSLAIMGLV